MRQRGSERMRQRGERDREKEKERENRGKHMYYKYYYANEQKNMHIDGKEMEIKMNKKHRRIYKKLFDCSWLANILDYVTDNTIPSSSPCYHYGISQIYAKMQLIYC